MGNTLTPEIIVMLGILILTIFIFVSEIVRVDVGAISIMLLIGLFSFVPGINPLIDNTELFNGFSSNAVISIMGVMILGAGLDKTGILNRLANILVHYGKHTETRITPLINATVGIFSGFMQNTGAAALFIPVVSRISSRINVPISRLLMPMGFCAIIGGTLTLVGSSPLILLNDLLPANLEAFDLFDVTPIGITLLVMGVFYFYFAGSYLLPKYSTEKNSTSGQNTTEYFKTVYGLEAEIYEIRIPSENPLGGLTIETIENSNPIRIIAAQIGGEDRIAPARDLEIEPGSVIAVLAGQGAIYHFVDEHNLELSPNLQIFSENLTHAKAGISEILIPPNSNLIGKTVSELQMRKTYGIAVLSIYRTDHSIHENLRDHPLQAGDTLVCHNKWDNLAALLHDRNFVVITTEFPHEKLRPHKVKHAFFFLALALSLVLFTDLRLSVALMTGAMGMILSGVLTIDEAYTAISWKTIFLLASLIPLGIAVENTGTAAWMANQILETFGNMPNWALQLSIAILATLFSLAISNVGATILIVPLAINIALATGADPRIYALLTALAASNAFILPTHQVNALIMTPGGYSVRDFIRTGSVITVLYLIVMLTMLNLIF